MQRYNASQMPVMDGEEIVSPLDDGHLFQKIMNDPSLAEKLVETVMDLAFPVVETKADIKSIAGHINKNSNVVLVKLPEGGYHIVTKHDIIGAPS